MGAPDFIIRSGDKVDFHVHREYLKLVSVFFRNLLDAERAAVHELERDGKPVVVLEEPHVVLYRLLVLAYPPQSLEHLSLTAQNLDTIWAVHEAANKYLFGRAEELIVDLLNKMLDAPSLVDAQPHRIFAIARARGLPELARKAALHTLKHPLCPPLLVPEMDLIPTSTFHQIYNFHNDCGAAAQRIVAAHSNYMDIEVFHDDDPYYRATFITRHMHTGRSLVWWDESKGYHSVECGGPISDIDEDINHYGMLPAQWFRNHMARVGDELRRLPVGETVKAVVLKFSSADRALMLNCDACRECAEDHLVNFASELAPRIEASNNRLGNLRVSRLGSFFC
ncbi:hypothetical protein C8R43DRAFT_869538 [Mycena crocata]|nr:hypothetical protein C8R43DRAFT_869538 [Mycena crocata]